jgi:hypothetical protein
MQFSITNHPEKLHSLGALAALSAAMGNSYKLFNPLANAAKFFNLEGDFADSDVRLAVSRLRRELRGRDDLNVLEKQVELGKIAAMALKLGHTGKDSETSEPLILTGD